MHGLPQTTYVRRQAGSVLSASLLWGEAGFPPSGAQRGKSAAQNEGLRFEEKVSQELTLRYEYFLPQVPFRFTTSYGTEKCILDGMLFKHRSLETHEIVLVEMKKRHTADAWFQLRQLYFPVVQKAFPRSSLRLLEICKQYEPGVRLPEPYKLHKTLCEYLESGAPFGVVSWR